jgi:Uri superfamily endonuclease
MKGAYCLVLEVLEDCSIKVGSLGNLPFKKGYYIYIGSAMNNLEKRIERHLRKEKKIHWHIDYLTASEFVNIKKAYIKESSGKEECEIAEIVSKQGLPVKGFGCSDCRCLSHHYRAENFSFLGEFMEIFG